MSLRDTFVVEGQRDNFYRSWADSEFERALKSLSYTPVDVTTNENGEKEIYIDEATYGADVRIIFSAGSKSEGRYSSPDRTGGRAVINLIYNGADDPFIDRNFSGLTTRAIAEKVLLRMRKIFVHEYTHHQDELRAQAPIVGHDDILATDSQEEKDRKWGEYYNSPFEYNANFQSITSMLSRELKKNPQFWSLDDFNTFRSRAITFIEKNYPMMWKYLSPDNKKRFYKRLTQFWLDLRGSG